MRLILPAGAGSGADTMLRASSQASSVASKHPVVIENQPGAGGITGTATLVKSPSDGFTLGMVFDDHVIPPNVCGACPSTPSPT